MKEVNLYTGYIDKRDVRRIENVCDYRIRVEEAEIEKIDFYTWGSY